MGGHLGPRLRETGADVVGCARHPAPGDVRADITDPSSLRAVLGPDRPADAVIHAAALLGGFGRRKDYTRFNVEGTRNVYEAARSAGAKRFIHISSISAMGFSPGLAADEETPCELHGDAYGDSKLASERLVFELSKPDGPAVTVIRPGNIWGPGSVPWVLRPLSLMREGRFKWVAGGAGHLAMVHVEDVVSGIILALKTEPAAGKIYILTDGSEGTTCRDYFTRLAEAAGVALNAPSLARPLALGLAAFVSAGARLLGRTPPFTPSAIRHITRSDCSYSCERARKELGYAPKWDLQTGMKNLAAELGGRSDTPQPVREGKVPVRAGTRRDGGDQQAH